jgi:hypothetical protein
VIIEKIQAVFVLGKFHIKFWILEFGIALGLSQATTHGVRGQNKRGYTLCNFNMFNMSVS